MPAKHGSKTVHVSGELYASLQKKMAAQGWNWGLTSYVEKVLQDFVDDKLSVTNDVATEKLFLTLFGLGMIDRNRLDQLLGLVKAGTLPETVSGDKFGIKIQQTPTSPSKKSARKPQG